MLATLIFVAGLGQLSVPIASAQVPVQLQWRTSLQVLPRLHRQMYWVYGGYTVLAIIAFAILSLLNAQEMADGSTLARCLCGYMAIFWCLRLCLQPFLAVKPHLRTWWLTLGYHALTIPFAFFTFVYGYAALQPLR
jgi:hypothetical protein